MPLTRVRRPAVALVTAVAFSLASTTVAVAAPAAALDRPGLPAPTPLVMVQAPLEVTPADAAAADPNAAEAPSADVPERVPGYAKVTLGKIILFLLALVGIVVLLAILFVALVAYDLTNDSPG